MMKGWKDRCVHDGWMNACICYSGRYMDCNSDVNLVGSLGVVNPVAEIFNSSRKNFRFSGKNLRGKNSDNLVVSHKIFTFSPFTPTFLADFSLFLIKKDEKKTLTYFLCKRVFSETRSRPPPTTFLRTPRSPAKNLGGATNTTPRIDS